MKVYEKEAKSILIKRKRIDSWFLSSYNMNLYRGCSHNCAYCDGRAENYFVKGEFGSDIEVKINAPEILEKELNPNNKRKPFEQGFILIGGGVCDTYEPIELKFELTRKALEIIKKYNRPVHILTKSNNIERDIDLLVEINKKSKVIVSFSFSTVDKEIAQIFEPSAPSPAQRLNTIRKLKEKGISTGIFLMPVIPFITDKPNKILEVYEAAKSIGADYLIFGGMTLKSGRQQNYFYNKLAEYDEKLLLEYSSIYRDDKWGNPVAEYYEYINHIFLMISKKFRIPKRIPNYIYKDQLDKNKYISVLLDQLDYLVKLNYGKSNYGLASKSIFELERPITELRNRLKTINGVGTESEKVIKEIMNSGTSQYYEKLL
jgi:DNA repair photolyase